MGKKNKSKGVSSSSGQHSSTSKSDEIKPPPSKKSKVVDETEWIQGSSSSSVIEPRTESSKKDEQKEETEKLKLLVAAFSNKQLDQYEVFRRSTFQKGTIRRLMQNVCGGTVSQNVVIAMAGMAKVFVGEIVEQGCQARDRCGEKGPLQPKHIREATRKLRLAKKLPNSKSKSTVSFR